MRRYAALMLALLLALFPVSAFAKINVPDIPYQNTNPNRYFIEVDKTNQIITIYEQDEQKNPTGIVRRFLCTTGSSEDPTPSGTFKLGDMRERFGFFANFSTYAQYWSQVTRGIYMHSILFSRRDNAFLERSAYNNIGKAVSHGCIRMMVEDARWVYYNCPPGTTITITRKPRNSTLAKALKTNVPFEQYKVSPDPYPQPAPVFGTITTKADYRTGFGGKDRRLGTLPAGTKVEITQLSAAWAKIRIDGTRKEGYIYTKYISIDSTNGTWVSVDRVKTATAKLYEKANTKSTVLATFGYKTDLKILSGSGKFYYVRVGSMEGYMSQSAIESIGMLLSPGETYTPVYDERPQEQPAPTAAE